jgi:cbb3-type cytochrome oxidase maturation protein
MSVMLILIFLGLVVAGGFLVAFAMSAQAGQFDDLETPAHRAIQDDPEQPESFKTAK